MSENENIKYPRKSEKYKGVYQRKNGTWFWRYKRKFYTSDKPEYWQYSGYPTEEAAHKGMLDAYRTTLHIDGDAGAPVEVTGTFGSMFRKWLESGWIESASSIKKYKALYDAQLSMWENLEITELTDAHIDIVLLRMALKPYSASYQNSVRKMLKIFFNHMNLLYNYIPGELAHGHITKPYKLRVLSLFSGIGAFEQGLKNLGIDFELVNFCEIEDNSAKAYCELHNVSEKLRIKDVTDIDYEYCRDKLPKFDLMVFGYPCQDNSTQGTRTGIMVSGDHPTIDDLLNDNLGDISRSGLFYKALQIALWTKPKFMIAENVAAQLNKGLEYDFSEMVKNIQEAGYNVYFHKLNSKDFGIPQNRPRAFIVMIRSDLNVDFKFPEPIPLTVRAEEWFENNVSEEYFTTPNQDKYVLNRTDYKANFKTDVISCIMTGWGTPSYTQQTFVKVGDRHRCLSSEELMRFQGFPSEYGTRLRNIGLSKNQVGTLVGNSITVPVLEEIYKQFVQGLSSQLSADVLADRFSVAQNKKEFIKPLFAYMGNKTKLLPYLDYLLPKDIENCTFIDMFTGSGTIALNVNAKRVIMNDLENMLVGIYRGLQRTPPDEAWRYVEGIVERFELSSSNEDGYLRCREEYNAIPLSERGDYWYWGLALIYHSFNRSHVNHNSDGEYNSSFGRNKGNIKSSEKNFFSFANELYNNGKYYIINTSYNEIENEFDIDFDKNTFLYVDPPYLITQATYNKGWNEDSDIALYDYLDRCSEKGVRWMLSNVIENKNKKNHIMIEWLKKNKHRYHLYFMKRDYSNSIYKHDKEDNENGVEDEGRTLEVVVTNYR